MVIENKKTMNVRIPYKIWLLLDKKSYKTKISKNELIVKSIEFSLKKSVDI